VDLEKKVRLAVNRWNKKNSEEKSAGVAERLFDAKQKERRREKST